MSLDEFISALFSGLFTGSAYAIAASGLVLTYTTTRVFNLGHGAIGMVMAFLYWELTVHHNVPPFWGAAIILLVIAPLCGVILERVMMRNLGDAPVSVSLVVTIGLFVLLVGVAQQVWPADKPRDSVPEFFNGKGFTIRHFVVSYHWVLTMGLAVLVAGLLYILLSRTRIGTSMRAVVDNKELLELFGASAARLSMLSWAIGSSLAALAGILLVSYVGLDYFLLTFLVINAFSAAMLGRLRSLPLTFIGGIGLGLAETFGTTLGPKGGSFTNLQAAIPTIMLFLVVIFVPQVRLRVGQIKGILSAPVPTARRAVICAIGFIGLTMLIAPQLSETNTLRFGDAIAFSLVMLSMVLLTGYGGYVSLAQMAFMGIGALVACKMDTTSPFAILAAAVITAAVGAVVALPVIRLTGLYLALATLAFAQLMDKLIFQQTWSFGFNGSLSAKRLSLFGMHFTSSRSYAVLMMIVFVLVGLGILALRRGSIGRLLIAMRDSPAACGTLGLNQRWFRVGLFAMSAGIAGLAGALVAGMRGLATVNDFQPFRGLLLLLLAVACGVTSITGAWLGGMLLMLLPVLQSEYKSLGGLTFLIIGAAAVSLGRDPNGIANHLFKFGRYLRNFVPLLSDKPAPEVRASRTADDVDDLVGLETEQVAGHGVA